MSSLLRPAVFLPLLISLATADAAAQCSAPLIGSTVSNKDNFGSCMAMDGPRAVIGSPRGEGTGIADGVVFVFDRVGADWNQSARLAVPQVGYVEEFGSSVDIDGDRIVGGAPYYSGSSPGAGGVFVFELVGGTWQLEAELVPAALAPADFFGWSVAIEGERLVAGAIRHPQPHGATGGLWVFERGPSGWVEVQELEPPPFTVELGTCVALSGDTILGGTDSGEVIVYELQGTTWVRTGELTPNPPGLTRFGRTISLQGDRALIGAPQWAGGGDAFVFERFAGIWYQRAHLRAPDGHHPVAAFGSGVALDGSRALVGAPFRHLYGINGMGTAYLFQQLDGHWQHSYQFVDPTPTTANSHFGAAVGIQGPAMLVGVPSDSYTAQYSGSVEAFTLPDSATTYCLCYGDTPCTNQEPMTGCRNSTGAGALLSPCGTDSAASDDLVFTASELPSNQPALLFAGTSEIEVPFGDGRLCTGGAVVRVDTRFANGAGVATYGPGIAASTGFAAGEVRLFQVWYRDPQGPCGSGFNTSNGLALRYGP